MLAKTGALLARLAETLRIAPVKLIGI